MIPATGIAEATDAVLQRRRSWAATGVIALLVLLTRVPYFFEYVIDVDESTYLLMGRSLLEGHLPYTQLWDAKPPLAFALVAAFIAGPGNDVVELRIWGAILVFISAMLLHSIVRRSVAPGLATPAALLFVIGCAVTESGQATMMEYVALPFLLGALRLLVDAPVSVSRAALAGALVAAAAMVRLNLAFVAPFVGLALLFVTWRAGAPRALWIASTYALGGCIVVALIAIPYGLRGELDLFVRSCLGAGVSHSASQSSGWTMIALPIERTFGFKRAPGLDNRAFMLALLVWFPAVLGATYVAWRCLTAAPARRHAMAVLGSAMCGVVLSILLAGSFYEHHTLQLLPFSAILAAIAYRQLGRHGMPLRVAVTVAAVIVAALALKPVPAQWKRVVDRTQSGHLMAGSVTDLADFLRPRCGADCTVFLMVDHLGYWLLQKPLPTRIAHPTNIAAPYVYTLPGMRSESPEQEFAAIFSGRPDYVVIRSATTRRPRVDDGYDIALVHLQRDYEKVHEYGSGSRAAEIYRRREAH